MSPHWSDRAGTPKTALRRLASVQIEAPRNARTEHEFGLHVGLWCGRTPVSVTLEGPGGERTEHFDVGFAVGEIGVDVEGGQISNAGRLAQEFFREKIVESAKESTGREGKVGGVLGFDLGKFLPSGKATMDAGGSLSRGFQTTSESNGEYYHVFWRVADAGRDFWRVFGYGLNGDHVLENRILPDEILCRVKPDADAARVVVRVEFRCDLRDLWFGPARTMPRDPREKPRGKDGGEESVNRLAVARAVVAKALRSRRASEEPEPSVLLCSHSLVMTRKPQKADAAPQEPKGE